MSANSVSAENAENRFTNTASHQTSTTKNPAFAGMFLFVRRWFIGVNKWPIVLPARAGKADGTTKRANNQISSPGRVNRRPNNIRPLSTTHPEGIFRTSGIEVRLICKFGYLCEICPGMENRKQVFPFWKQLVQKLHILLQL